MRPLDRYIYYSLGLVLAILASTLFIALRWEFALVPVAAPQFKETLGHFLLSNRIMDVLAVGFTIFAAIVCCSAILRRGDE